MTTAATAYGSVLGTVRGGVVRFAGIPYAAAPVGPARFAPPRPPEPWLGVRDALVPGAASLQNGAPLQEALGISSPATSEDCLSLTVHTPAADGSARPVMVWIHGGGFVTGSGGSPMWDPSRLVRRGDVVVVSLNYRLGALGFLHVAELDPALPSSGLNGILDQVAGLEWVRANIAAFGGDPGNVTVFGASAGAMSIAVLLNLPAAKGLFRRAILQSGAGHDTVSSDEAARRAARFCELAGCKTMDELRLLAASRMLDVQAALGEEVTRSARGSWSKGFQPVVDGHHLTARPIDLACSGALAPVGVLLGTTDDEWRMFSWLEPEPISDADVAERFAADLAEPSAAISVYRRRLGAAAAPRAIADAMMTDLRFRMPMQRLADAAASAGHPTWVYRFGYRTPVSDGVLGSCHALDVPFVFDNRAGAMKRFVGDRSPDALADAMQRSWLSFARYGDPNHDGIPTWQPQVDGRRQVLRFDETVRVLEDPEGDELAVWDAVP